ncbi:HTH-type transcriptional repressor YvoA [Sporomusa ovata DSM 2662]|uniref:Transcriptional regulator, GntR family n=1 Tax=Sporomusa ovata TaxID=2378 RepID=A0A0U1L631_9FIRM|nr:UTRA domain-containing protein [Sporomusa ovata]EQB24815.1 transcriptional regulator, GntR family [Sporomusa ovata DSM 2662]CQR75162.1 Transcriptional regulator, GntR family [Sporomusa ovata]
MRSRENLIPVYYRLADDIKQQIEAGVLKDGDLIPTEAQLGEQYAISRMTVRQGIALLAEAGLIATVKGKGSFVTRPRLNQLVIDLTNSGVSKEQLRYKLVSVNLVRNNLELAHELGLSGETNIIAVKRLLFKGQLPVAIEEKFLRYQKGKPLLETQLEYADFPELVAKHQDSVPVRNDMVISVAALSAEQAKLLETEEVLPALVVKQVIYAKEDKPLGVSIMVCHKDRFELKATSYPLSGRL